ncbi:MAG: hypothetical protein HC896_12350 [Bacteroidales bacterium]|nr:hypothetical protein [Bacteroidales bacterium]
MVGYSDVVVGGLCPVLDTIFRTWHVEDSCGNTTEKVQVIVRQDTLKPIALANALSILLDNQTGVAAITADSIDNGSYDACGPVVLSIDTSMFYCTDVGLNQVILTVTDQCNNKTTDTTTVTVDYEVQPQITVLPADSLFCTGGSSSIALNSNIDSTTYTWTVATHVDISGYSNGTATTAYNIEQTLVNAGDTYRPVTYTVSTVLYGLCPFDTNLSVIYVESKAQD